MARALHQAVRNNEPLAYEESRVNKRENFQLDFCPDVFFRIFGGNLNLQIFSEVCRRMRFHGFRFQPKKSMSFETFSDVLLAFSFFSVEQLEGLPLHMHTMVEL